MIFYKLEPRYDANHGNKIGKMWKQFYTKFRHKATLGMLPCLYVGICLFACGTGTSSSNSKNVNTNATYVSMTILNDGMVALISNENDLLVFNPNLNQLIAQGKVNVVNGDHLLSINHSTSSLVFTSNNGYVYYNVGQYYDLSPNQVQLTQNSSSPLYAFFSDESNCYVVGYNGQLFIQKGGATDSSRPWQEIYLNGNSLYAGYSSLMPRYLVLVGDNGLIWWSDDDGISWAQPKNSSITQNDLYNITYVNNVWFIVGDLGTVLRSQNGDINNLQQLALTGSNITQENIRSITFVNNHGINRILIAATNGKIDYSDDNGNSWSPSLTNSNLDLTSIECDVNRPGRCYAVGGCFLMSNDYGNTWQTINPVGEGSGLY